MNLFIGMIGPYGLSIGSFVTLSERVECRFIEHVVCLDGPTDASLR